MKESKSNIGRGFSSRQCFLLLLAFLAGIASVYTLEHTVFNPPTSTQMVHAAGPSSK